MDEDANGLAFAGTGGFVALGAQVVVLNDTGTQNAHIDDGAAIAQAGGGIDVTATAHRNVSANAIGGSAGAFTTGASVAVLNVKGNATATVGNVLLGGFGVGVGHLHVGVTDDVDASTEAITVEAGVGVGIGGAVAFSSLEGTASASSGAHGAVGSGGVSITALGTHTATADTINVSTGIAAAGLTISRANNGRSTEATMTSTGDVSTTGAVLIQANATNVAEATAPGGSAGGVTIDVMLAFAFVTGRTRSRLDGTIEDATTITVQSLARRTRRPRR